MSKAFVLASALLVGGAAFGLSGKTALAEEKGADAVKEEKSADAVKKERCERDATLMLYTGKQKTRYIRQCLAGKEQAPRKAAVRPGVYPPGPAATPRPAPLGGGNPPSTSTGSTAPSNAPVAPSAPVVGSSGTSTTGSSATSTSGSSGSSLGGSSGSSGGR
jgi:hypothetical protein